ncbi:MAG: (2Fe-2S)-binding protein [Pseudomonadales bacterium]
MLKLMINGKSETVDASPDTPLLWVLRDHLHLTGTKYGCGINLCGACTVHINGAPVRSCGLPVESAVNQSIETIESLARDGKYSAVQQAWLDADVAQCGYCQSGQIMAATALLRQFNKPNDQQIDDAMNGHICRCGTYQKIREAIHHASALIEQGSQA